MLPGNLLPWISQLTLGTMSSPAVDFMRISVYTTLYVKSLRSSYTGLGYNPL